MGRYVTVETEVEIDIVDVIEGLGQRELAEVKRSLSADDPEFEPIRDMVDALKLAAARRDLQDFLRTVERIADRSGVILDTSRLLPAH